MNDGAEATATRTMAENPWKREEGLEEGASDLVASDSAGQDAASSAGGD